jgi:hypothetical protein
LKSVFGRECVGGKIKANWLNGNLLVPQGELIQYFHDGYQSIYERELELTFQNGLLTSQTVHDNSKSHKSIYTESPDSLRAFVFGCLDWSKISASKNEVTLHFKIESGDSPSSYVVELMRGSDDEILNQEVTRAIKMLPDWDVYYRHGEAVKIVWIVPIIINEDTRKRYFH